MSAEPEYIVVGAGPAGCVVANRLSANHRVLLVEAGGPDSDEWIHVPGGFLRVVTDTGNIWRDQTVPSQHINDRSITLVQGRMLGGSSAVNGMLYVRGQRADYESWSDAGCRGWSWPEVLPRFIRQTSFAGTDPEVYGRTGELKLCRLQEPHSTSDAFVAAARQAGLPFREDINGGDQEGVSYAVGTISHGRRQTASVAFIDPIADRRTLEVMTRSSVQRVVFDGKRAVGVEIQSSEGTRTVTCTREVVLSAGAISSPCILQYSGIGGGDHLRALGIDVVSDVPEVGENLQDHLFGHLKFRLAEDKHSLNDELASPERTRQHLETWRKHGSGPLTTTSAQVLAFVTADDSRPSPNLQLAMRPLSWAIGKLGVPELDRFPGMMASAINTQPYSRGRVTITSGNPGDRGNVDPGYLSDGRDIDVIITGIRHVRRIMHEPAISDRVVAELDPGEEVVSDRQLQDYVRASAATVYHPVGTCRMGSDASSVVDPQLRVRGVSHLRVIDASIMPTITSGNTMAPAFLIGEMGAGFILSS